MIKLKVPVCPFIVNIFLNWRIHRYTEWHSKTGPLATVSQNGVKIHAAHCHRPIYT